jgi:hypothetical protein
MGRYEEVTRARKLLELSESATMDEIRSSYRRLVRKWHPDVSSAGNEESAGMTRRLTEAYETLVAYCRVYRVPFTKDEVKKYESGEDWWLRRFGDDPVWGGGEQKR